TMEGLPSRAALRMSSASFRVLVIPGHAPGGCAESRMNPESSDTFRIPGWIPGSHFGAPLNDAAGWSGLLRKNPLIATA
ncbi:hypothetical protein, partial [Rhodoplanes roseus]|uniref:hypothetical protein n=1 Tax=Rhodoplanes roseus TaxID=29409 RepID=UPI001AED0505